MRIRFDVQDEKPTIVGDLPDMRRVGVERILDQEEVQIVVAVVQSFAACFPVFT